MEITALDAGNLLKIIDRVDIKGNEATAVAILQQKLIAILNVPPEPQAEEELTRPTANPAAVIDSLEGKKK